jgi:hypothetical protein
MYHGIFIALKKWGTTSAKQLFVRNSSAFVVVVRIQLLYCAQHGAEKQGKKSCGFAERRS